MIKPLSSLLLLGTLGFMSACGSDGGSAAPQTGNDSVAKPGGFPFVQAAIVASDLCPGAPAHSCLLGKYPPAAGTHVTLSQPDVGTLCVTGKVGDGGWVYLVFSFTDYGQGTGQNEIIVKSTLDADKLGITQVGFTLDTAPADGIVLDASVITQSACSGPTPVGCRSSGYQLTDSAGNLIHLAQSGPTVVPLASFIQNYPDQGPENFDTSALGAIELELDSGEFDFCVSDFKLLDADGNEVTP